MTTTYYYTTKKGNLVETFDTKGYVTLETENGVHIYEHQFNTMGVKLQQMQLHKMLLKHNVKFTVKVEE